MIKVENASFAYEKEIVLHHLNVEINKNKMTGIIGPNGSGKTTFIKTLTGILSLTNGKISLDNKDLKLYTKKQLAKKISVLSQHISDGFQFTVYEIVSLGRYAHQNGLFSTWSDEDERIVQLMMEQTGVAELSKRTLDTLSGGEKQRVFLAQCLAQQPDIIILDEPTNHLDIKYQIEICELLKSLVISSKMTVICIFHDLNLASLFCDEIILMNEGHIIAKNQSNKILIDENIKDIYHLSLHVGIHPNLPNHQIFIQPKQNRNERLKIDIFQENYLVTSNLDLKCMSTVEGITWRKSFILEEFNDIKEISKDNSNVKIIIATSKQRKIIMVVIDGIVEDTIYLKLLTYISKNYQFDEIIMSASFREENKMNFHEIKKYIEQKLM